MRWPNPFQLRLKPMPTPPRGHTSLTAFLGGMIMALSFVLSPVRAADSLGYLRVSGPAPIRFQTSHTDPTKASTLVSGPIDPSLASLNQRPVSSTLADGTSPHVAPATHSQYWSEALTTTAPGIVTGSPTETFAAVDPIHPSPNPEPSSSASSPTQLRQGDPIGIITPQAILPLILDNTTDPTVRVAIVTPLSFVPPQSSPGVRSRATYSVTP